MTLTVTSCGSFQCPETDRGQEGESGLILGQGYTLTAAKLIEVKKSHQGAVGTNFLQLVRLFNPWEAKEWTGAWSDGWVQMKRGGEGGRA